MVSLCELLLCHGHLVRKALGATRHLSHRSPSGAMEDEQSAHPADAGCVAARRLCATPLEEDPITG